MEGYEIVCGALRVLVSLPPWPDFSGLMCLNPPTYLVSCLVSFNGSKGFPRLLTNTKSPGVSAMPSPSLLAQ